MSPFCSATGMKSAGLMRPRSGWCQRTRASAGRDAAGPGRRGAAARERPRTAGPKRRPTAGRERPRTAGPKRRPTAGRGRPRTAGRERPRAAAPPAAGGPGRPGRARRPRRGRLAAGRERGQPIGRRPGAGTGTSHGRPERAGTGHERTGVGERTGPRSGPDRHGGHPGRQPAHADPLRGDRPGSGHAVPGRGRGLRRATLFSIDATGEKDDKGRPTYTIYNDAHGFVQWWQEKSEVYVEQTGDGPPGATFSFVDRGPL
jgi:hypothetical protein